jgi:hypothetical protein
MSRARILADYVSSGDELADKAPLASPAFTGTPTGITAAHLEAGVLPSDVTGGSGLTALGTVTAGTLGSGVTGGSGLTALEQIYWKGGPTTRDTTSGWHEIALNTTLASNIQSYFTIGSTSITISHAGFYHFYGHTKIDASQYSFGNSVMVNGNQRDHRESEHYHDKRVPFDWTGELSATNTLSVRVYKAVGNYACEACTGSESTVVNLVYLGE